MLRIDNVGDMVAAIRRLPVRGAPAIGVALAVQAHGTSGPAFDGAVASLRESRPTAVNLARMVDRAASRAPKASTRSWPRPVPSETRSRPRRSPRATSVPTWCSSVDADTPDGAGIAIEDRGADEVVSLAGVATAPDGTAAANPAFDITPPSS